MCDNSVFSFSVKEILVKFDQILVYVIFYIYILLGPFFKFENKQTNKTFMLAILNVAR